MEDITLKRAKTDEFTQLYGIAQLHGNPDWDRHLANILDDNGEIVGRVLSNRNHGKMIAYFLEIEGIDTIDELTEE